jgi:DNA-binding CsgD family transcriptional regulator
LLTCLLRADVQIAVCDECLAIDRDPMRCHSLGEVLPGVCNEDSGAPLFTHYARRAAPKPIKQDKRTALTAKQRAVLGLVAQGETYQTIAQHLGLHVSTLTGHMRRVCHKLNVFNRAEAVEVARARGLL